MQNYLYGKQPVLEFLKSAEDDHGVEAVYVTDNLPSRIRDILFSTVTRAKIKVIPRKEIDRFLPEANHQGVVIRLIPGFSARSKREANWKDFLKNHSGPMVALDRIQDPQNLGSIIRSAEALGATGVFITGKGSPLTAAAQRTSAGAFLHIAAYQIPNINQLIDEAKKEGFWIVSSIAEEIPEKNQTALSTDDLSSLPEAEKILLIIGSEGEGIKASSVEKSDYLLTIPLRGKISSLNAGVAAGILLDRIINR